MPKIIAGLSAPPGSAAFTVGIVSLVVLAAYALVLGQHRRQVAFLRTQEALRGSEERLRLALEATTEIVWDYDVVSGAVWHPRWAQVYGYPPEATPATMAAVGPYVHPEDLPVFAEQTEAVIAGPRDAFEVEHRVRTASGEWRWMLGKASVVARDSSGRAVRIVGTCADITERKRMLARLQVADRMASVGTLAAGVAHEINNPLAYVTGNLGYAIEALGDVAGKVAAAGAPASSVAPILEECCRALREAEDGALRVRTIVRDLKLFSRAEEDERRTPVDVRRVLESALNVADGEIRRRARLVTRMSEVPPVLADASRLSQVFLNLLVNAVQSIPDGHADSNRIEVEVRAGSGGRVVLEVRDTGCGIPSEQRKRIFDPFFTTKPIGVGTGLGLAICHGIVSALGGDIEVESEAGVGSTFRVSLPAATGSAAVEVPRGAGPRDASTASRRARVLVVDDEPLFCRTVERVLAPAHEVVSVGDPEEALARIQTGETFDVVLSDLLMPRMTGMDLHAAIARVAPALARRMLFVTGGACTAAAHEFVSSRPDRVLEKPLEPAALRDAVNDVILRRE